jgi:hypothetical protein
MPSDPTSVPAAAPRKPMQSPGGAAPDPQSPPDALDADAAEPVPHEHLPSRSDDN